MEDKSKVTATKEKLIEKWFGAGETATYNQAIALKAKFSEEIEEYSNLRVKEALEEVIKEINKLDLLPSFNEATGSVGVTLTADQIINNYRKRAIEILKSKM